MAANNYYGFTHGGTQYTTPAATFPTGQAGYAVNQSYTQAQRPNQPAYEGYQSATHAAGSYGFPARQQQESAPPLPPTTTTPSYEAYSYQRPAAAAAAATTPTYDGTKSYYQQQQQQASKPAYTANSTYVNPNRPNNNNAKPAANNAAYGYSSAAVSTSYPTNYSSNNNSGTPVTTASTYSGGFYNTGYDAALYSAATMYVQQQQSTSAPGGGGGGVGGGGPGGPGGPKPNNNNWNTFKKPGMKMMKPKQPPKPQQLHYCDVCKISCAGPQTYREHLEGQKHKKKEAAAKVGIPVTTARPGNSLRCELCDVTCTGSDAYAAHIRGAKHQKVVKLHTKLGKPIPSTEPTVIGTPAGATPAAAVTPAAPKVVKKAPQSAAPKITFVGGTKLSTTAPTNPASEVDGGDKSDEKEDDDCKDDRSDVLPVGQDYIEEIKSGEGKVLSFQCKLCECKFNDPNAKEMHMKGRRHRLQYKKKVNPDLVVDIKPSLRQRKIQEDKMRRQLQKEDFWRRRDDDRWRDEMRMMEEDERIFWEERRHFEEEKEYFDWYRRFGRGGGGMPPPAPMMRGGPMVGPGGPPMPPRRPDSLDDRHMLAKHSQIYPKELELQAVQKLVSNTEKALKMVSDFFAEIESPGIAIKKEKDVVKPSEPAPVDGAAVKPAVSEAKSTDSSSVVRILKGVMRVGVLAKGLLLQGDKDVQLVVLCSEKPTVALQKKVFDNLPIQMAVISDDKYEFRSSPEMASIYVSTTTEPNTMLTVLLTSPVVRSAAEEGESVTLKDPPDVLDRQKCLDALAALRHAKWFQARASGLQSCVLVIRILRDLCQRVPTWTPLNNWALELLVEKTLCSAGIPMSPGDALRRVLEALASGVLLPGGPGLLDPCEKDPTDSAANLTDQEREDITASAQHALRLLAFRQIHKVLGMDPLPVPKFVKGRFTRKRRRDNSSGEPNEGADGKKDKKDDGDGKMETEAVTVPAS